MALVGLAGVAGYAGVATLPGSQPLPPPQAPAKLFVPFVLAEAPPTQAAPVAPPAAASGLNIRRTAQGWRIDATGASRAQAALPLAALSATPVFGAEHLHESARPLHLHWQGSDLAQAWRAVFGDEFSHALQCQGQACRAWFFGHPGQAAAAPARQAVAVAQAVAHAVAIPTPPVLNPPVLTHEVPDPHDRVRHD